MIMKTRRDRIALAAVERVTLDRGARQAIEQAQMFVERAIARCESTDAMKYCKDAARALDDALYAESNQ